MAMAQAVSAAPAGRSLLRLEIRDIVWWLLWFQSGVEYGILIILARQNVVLYYTFLIPSVLFLAGLAILVMGKRLTLPLHGLGGLVVLLNATNIASVLLSPVEFESPVRIVATAVSTLVLSMIVLVLAQDRPADALLRNMGRAYVLGAAVTALAPVLVGGLATLGSPRYGFEEELISPNLIGFEAAIALLFTVGQGGQRLWGLLDWPLAALFTSTLILTFSKTAIVAAAVSLGLIWMLSGVRGRLRERFLGAAAVLIPFVLLWHRLLGETIGYIQETGASSTLSGRIPLWDIVLNLSAEHPWLGYGFATAREVLRPYSVTWGTDITHAHNAYLTALLQTGYTGAVLLTLIVLAVVWQAVRLLRARRHPAVRLWIALVALVVVHSLTEGALGSGSYSFALLVGLGAIGNRLAIEVGSQAQRSG